jgi:hypothetical protein
VSVCDEPACTAVTALVENTFAALYRIATATTALWDAAADHPQAADLAGLRRPIFDELRSQGPVFNGAGVVVASGVLADRARHLEWWRADPSTDGGAQPLQLDLDPRSEYFYDYPAMEWFSTPRDTGTRTVHGPYLDFTGVDLYICTFAVPIRSGCGTFLGVAGADVPVVALDTALMPVFRAGGRPVALVNGEGRVIVANHADHVTGSRLRGHTGAVPHPVPATSWSLVHLDAESA